MKKVLTAALVVLMGLAFSPLQAKDHTFKLMSPATLNGTDLEPGEYKLKLNGDNEAEIWRNGEKLATAKVELKLLNGVLPKTVLVSPEGELKQVRTKEQIVAFVS